MAKQGQMGAVKIMAKDLVRTRNYVTKFIELRSHLQAVSMKLQTMQSHEAMSSAMKNVTKAMVKMNKQMDIPALQKIMAEFMKENERSEMTQEMMGDLLDDAMEEEGDDEEEEKIVGQVLAELNINFDEAIPDAPGAIASAPVAAPAAAAPAAEAPAAAAAEPAGGGMDELEARLNNLKRG